MSSIIDKPAVLGCAPVRTADYPAWPVSGRPRTGDLSAVLDAGGWWLGDGVAATFADEFAPSRATWPRPYQRDAHVEAALAACEVGGATR